MQLLQVWFGQAWCAKTPQLGLRSDSWPGPSPQLALRQKQTLPDEQPSGIVDAVTGDDAVMLRRSPGAVAVAEVATDHVLSLMKWCVLTRC